MKVKEAIKAYCLEKYEKEYMAVGGGGVKCPYEELIEKKVRRAEIYPDVNYAMIEVF